MSLSQQEDKLSLFHKKKSHCAGVIGLTFFSDGLALVHLEHNADDSVQLKFAHSTDCASAGHAAVLTELVHQQRLQNIPCVAVLARGSYSLIQVDKPDVPEEEMRDALRWQIKDLLDFPAEDAIIDLFSAGNTNTGGASQAAFAVAAAEKKVRYVVDAMRSAGLAIKAIDIPELALRNILATTAENQRGVALLNLWDDNGLITVVHNGELCMARRINLGMKELIAAGAKEVPVYEVPSAADPAAPAAPAAPDAAVVAEVEISQAQQNILDDLVLEIQRSLDYYESSVAHQAVSALLVAPSPQPVPGLEDYLRSYLAPKVRALDVTLLVGGATMSTTDQSRCLSAIGAALRSDVR